MIRFFEHKGKYAAAAAALALLVSGAAYAGEEEEYAAALAMYERRLFKVSYQYFQGFIAKFPESVKSDSAQFYLAESLRSLGSYPEAIHEYRRLTADYPESPYVGKALVKLGDCFRAVGNSEGAEVYYREAIPRAAEKSDVAEAYVNLGEVFFARRDFQETISVYEDARTRFTEKPWRALILYRLGLAYFLAGDVETALGCLSEVDAEDPVYRAAASGAGFIMLDEGRYEEALDVLDGAFDPDKPGPYDDAGRYGVLIALTGAGRYEEAVAAAYKAGLRADGGSAIPETCRLYLLGYNLFRLGAWEDARAAFAGVRDDGTDGELSVMADLLTSFCFLEEGKLEPAREKLLEISSTDSVWSAEAKYWLGWISYEEGKPAESVKWFRAVTEDPAAGETAVAASYWLAYCEKLRGNARVAEEVFVRFAKEHPESALADNAFLSAAELAFGDGRNDEGRAKLTELVDAYPESPLVEKAVYLIAHSYAGQKDPGPAISKLKEFLANYPESEYAPEATYDIGTVHFGRGDYSAAAVWFEKVISQYPDSRMADDAMYQEGQCKFNVRDYKAAREIYESLAARYPESPRVDEARYQVELCKFKAGEYSSNVEVAEVYVVKYPKSKLNPELYLLLGQHYLKKGDYAASVGYLRRVEATSPAAFLTARNTMYEAYRKRGMYKEAAGVLRSIASSTVPREDRAKALYDLAELYEATGDADAAIRAYGDLARTFPEDERAPKSLLAAGVIMRDAGMYSESNVLLEELIAKYPGWSDVDVAELYAAFNYQRLGDYAKAIKHHKKVIGGGRRSLAVQSYYWLGICELDLGNREAAREYLNKVVTNFRDYPKWVEKAERELRRN